MQAYFEPEQDFSISMPQPVAVFCQPPRLLTLEIFANLPVYYFGRNLSASPFIPPSPSIWNSRVSTFWFTIRKKPNG